jgi:hypothetical protein
VLMIQIKMQLTRDTCCVSTTAADCFYVVSYEAANNAGKAQ